MSKAYPLSRAPRATRQAHVEPRLRRAYFDCRYGQLHMHYAIPAGGGFDEATTLLCLPGDPGSGRFFRPLLSPLGQDRSVFAPDLPGCGESDPMGARIDNSGIAAALCDFVDSMRFGRIDLLAHDSGVAVALALAEQRPALVGRMVLSSDTEAVRAQARVARHPVLVIDLSPVDAPAASATELARQAGELRQFLGLP